MKNLSLNEIENRNDFEDLVAAYFRQVKLDKEFNVESVEAQQTGTGGDGGRDILVSFIVNDSVMTFKRIGVVQCKFYNQDVSKSHLSDINIPSLIHQYGANEYLLICKKNITATLSASFESLNKNCKFGYRYKFWNQNNLLGRIRLKEDVVKTFFPLHAKYLKKQETKKLNFT